MEPQQSPPPETLLVVCRANLIRSPIAAGLLRRDLADAGVNGLVVVSAGLQPGTDVEPIDDAVKVARDRGVDLTDHEPAGVTADLVSDAAIVLTMTEAQRAAVSRLVPGATPRTFTLTELVRLTDAPDFPPARSWGDLARRAHLRRPFVAAAAAPEDVPDPVGRGKHYLQVVADDLARLCQQVSSRIAPPASAEDDGSPSAG